MVLRRENAAFFFAVPHAPQSRFTKRSALTQERASEPEREGELARTRSKAFAHTNTLAILTFTLCYNSRAHTHNRSTRSC